MTSPFHRGFHSLCWKLFRLRKSWTLYLVIAAGLVFIVRMHYGHQQIIELTKSAVRSDDEDPEFPVQFTTTTSTTTTSTTTTKSTPSTTKTTEQTSSTLKSTCSAAADRRGPHQNVIGYSIYGKNFSEPKFFRKYLKSFTDTLKTIPIRYPGILHRKLDNLFFISKL
jgi:hypothetical protein